MTAQAAISPVRGKRWIGLLPALLVALLSLGSAAVAGYAPPQTGQMAIVFPPWIDQPHALAAIGSAGGSLVASTRFANIVVAYAPDAGFVSRAIAAGALFAMSAQGPCAPQAPLTRI
jgi:hypothetical protein